MHAHTHVANKADLAALQTLVGHSIEGMPPGTPPSERRRMLAHVLGDLGFQVHVATVDGAPVGYVMIRFIGDPRDEGAAGMVSDLFVAAKQRRQGIGTGLLQAAINECRRRGYTEVRLWANQDSQAIRTYRRHGFCPQRVEMRLELPRPN